MHMDVLRRARGSGHCGGGGRAAWHTLGSGLSLHRSVWLRMRLLLLKGTYDDTHVHVMYTHTCIFVCMCTDFRCCSLSHVSSHSTEFKCQCKKGQGVAFSPQTIHEIKQISLISLMKKFHIPKRLQRKKCTNIFFPVTLRRFFVCPICNFTIGLHKPTSVWPKQ